MLPSISIGITRECAAPTDVPIAAIATTAPKARFLKPPLWPTLRLNRLFFLFNIALTSPETATSQCLGPFGRPVPASLVATSVGASGFRKSYPRRKAPALSQTVGLCSELMGGASWRERVWQYV